MVKFGKNKLKALNKLVKKQSSSKGSNTNKVLKKKINAEKKVSFQKEVLIKEAVSNKSLVQTVTKKEILLNEILKKATQPPKKTNFTQAQDTDVKPKLKPVKKQKQRQKILISDTKMLLNLMKKK